MNKEFPDEYVESVFYMWYEGGRKESITFLNTVPTAPDGRILKKPTLAHWVRSRGWIERADALDAEASRSLDELVIERRRKMYEEQVRVADDLVKKGMEYLNAEGKGIQTDSTAIRAIDLGLATQRISTGMAEAYVKISKMSDDQLNQALQKLLGTNKVENEDMVDAEILEEE